MPDNPRPRPLASSVRLRLTLWNVLVLGLVLIVTGVLLRQSVQQSLVQTVDDDLTSRWRGWQSRWPPPDNGSPRPHPPTSKDEILRPRLLRADGLGYWSHDAQALLAPGAIRTCFTRAQPIFETIMLEGEPVRVLTAPLVNHAGQVDAALQTGESLSNSRHELHVLSDRLLEMIPIALLIAGFGAAFLTDRAMRPVRAVTRAAEGIGVTQDLSARLSVPGDDEFSHLASTFNGMISRLEGAFHDLEEAYEQQRRFVADASHELRTPLTIIKANTSLALSDPDLDKDTRETLSEIDRGVDRTSRIVQDLFLLARSDSGQLPLDDCRVNLGELLQDVCNQRRFLSSKDGAMGPEIRLLVSGESADDPIQSVPPLYVRGDPTHLERLFNNLLENALRHTLGEGSVTIRATPVGLASVEVAVADTGEGIAPEHLPRIRERFYRVDSARARSDGGTGLGLSICEAIAHAHGGSIALESQPGVGTTVRVTLPADPA